MKTSLFCRAMLDFLTEAAPVLSRIVPWGWTYAKGLYTIVGSVRNIAGKGVPPLPSSQLVQDNTGNFLAYPLIKQKTFGTGSGVLSSAEWGSHVAWQRAGTGSCFCFLPQQYQACQLWEFLTQGAEQLLEHLQCAGAGRLCSHCNTAFIFPVTVQPKKCTEQRIKHLDKVFGKHSSETNPEMAALYF